MVSEIAATTGEGEGTDLTIEVSKLAHLVAGVPLVQVGVIMDGVPVLINGSTRSLNSDLTSQSCSRCFTCLNFPKVENPTIHWNLTEATRL